MRPDFLTKKAMSRATDDSLNYQLKRGRLSSLLFINSMSWHFKDRITVKLRHPGGLITVVDRISALLLLQLCDLKQGKPTVGTINTNEDEVPNGLVTTNSGQTFVDNAFLLPLGHLTLENCELEIIVETAAQPAQAPATSPSTGIVKIVAIETATSADILYTYDINSDLENTAHQVREIYLVSSPNDVSFFTLDANNATVGKDVVCRLDVDGSMYEVDVETLGAITSITGELSQAPNGLVKAFQESGTIGATVGIKIFGNDKAMAQLLYIKELIVPGMVAQSVHSAIALEQRKVERLELREPEQAAALVATGKISTSAVLAEAKAQLPAPVAMNA